MERYRAFLATKIGRAAPATEDEAKDQGAADLLYEQCGIWLRENTRDAKKFPILFSELVTYGFRRNLLGLKWSALVLNLIVVVICAGLLWYRALLGLDEGFAARVSVVLIVAAIHALYIAFVVTWGGVEAAARTYARQLILSCETFLRGTTPREASRKRVSTTKAA